MRLWTHSSYTGEQGWSNPPRNWMGKGQETAAVLKSAWVCDSHCQHLRNLKLRSHTFKECSLFREVANSSIKTIHGMCTPPPGVMIHHVTKTVKFWLISALFNENRMKSKHVFKPWDASQSNKSMTNRHEYESRQWDCGGLQTMKH